MEAKKEDKEKDREEKEEDYEDEGLVSLFNGISTLFRLFNTKAILLEEQ